MKQAPKIRQKLCPPSPDAFIHFAPILVLLYGFFATAILGMTYACPAGVLHLLANEGDIRMVSLALCACAGELFVLVLCIAHYSSPRFIPFHRVLHAPLRYRRTHISHMRLDRLRRHLQHKITVVVDRAQSTSDQDSGCRSPASVHLSFSCSPRLLLQRHRLVGGGGSLSPDDNDVVDISSDDQDEDTSSSDVAFDRSQWIGCGQVWSESIPGYVQNARNAARRIPPGVREALIPPATLSVSELVSPPYSPPQYPELPHAPTYVGSHEPNILHGSSVDIPTIIQTSCRTTLYRALPHIRTLRSSFSDEWLAGARAVHFEDSPTLFYPLWIENLIGELDISVQKQKKWFRAVEWLEKVADSTNERTVYLTEECYERLQEVCWNSAVPGFGRAIRLTTLDLALFLSDEWLNDEMLNAGSEFIMRHLGTGSTIRIANCFLLNNLRAIRDRNPEAKYSVRQQSVLDCAIQRGEVSILEVPVNPGRTHWAGIRVDLVRRTFAYLDGYNPTATPSRDDLDIIVWYITSLEASDKDPFTVTTTTVPVPRQHDSHSCGVVYLSTLASQYLRYSPWSQATHAVDRMEWFLRLSETLCSHEVSSELSDSPVDTPPASTSFLAPTASSETMLSARLPESVNIELDDVEMEMDSEILRADALQTSLPTASNVLRALDSERQVSVHIASPTSIVESPSPRSDDSDNSDISGCGATSTMSMRSHAGRKHRSPSLSSDDELSDSQEAQRVWRRGRPEQAGGKPGSSWKRQKGLKTAALSADFKPSATRLDQFKEKVLTDDPKAMFRGPGDREVRCSACTQWIIMRTLYDLRRWKEHRNSKRCAARRATGLSTKPLSSYFSQKPPASPSTGHSVRPEPEVKLLICPGLTRESDTRIDVYLGRSSALGGGAPSRLKIALELFNLDETKTAWSDLSPQHQKMVLRREEMLFKWRNRRAVNAIFSSNCQGEASSCSSTGEPQPCTECRNLLKLHTFQVILNRKMPSEKNMKYVPKRYRCPELGGIYLKYEGVRELVEADDGQSPWLRFAKGAAEGLYKSQQVVLGMIEALVKKSERLAKGKSLANMTYAKAFDAFCSVMASVSPRAYKTFQGNVAGRGLRSMRERRSKMPRFQPGFSQENIKLAATTLLTLAYKGPLSLSWDDTDLEKALSIWRESQGVWAVIGVASGPIRVTSEDEVEAVLTQASLEKADKLRIWVLTIPLPRIPPILLAAVARGSEDTAESLAQMHFRLTEMMHEEKIYGTSLAADGTETERAAQRIIFSYAPSVHRFSIYSEIPGCTLDYSIPLYYGRPAVLLQDSKHGLKTSRNQLLTGARNLVLGNFPLHFKMLRDFAEHELGPLFRRDVEKVDKQDDRAAARLFSCEALDFHLRFFPDQVALSIYLFILGELVDAWQNRRIPHLARAKMVLRARFFLMAWRNHIEQHPDHRTHIQFISHESFDIFLTLCDSLLQLMVVYRQYYPMYPLLPWLHSTETCEHIFGMLRQLKEDFNYADMLYLEPKLRTLMLGAFENLTAEEKANQTAAGYHHTYFHAPDLDMATLMQWPSDVDLQTGSKDAFTEAEQLLAAVGIDARVMLASYRPPDVAKTVGLSKRRPEQPRTLADLLALYSATLVPTQVEDQAETCEMALVAEDVDKTLAILALPDSTPSDDSKLKADIEAIVTKCEAVAASSPSAPTNVSDTSEASQQPCRCHVRALQLIDSVSLELSRTAIVSIRRHHQPLTTARAVRQANRMSTPSLSPVNSKLSKDSKVNEDVSIREALKRRLATLMGPGEVQHISGPNKSKGVNRQVRHTGTYATDLAVNGARAKQKETSLNAAALKFYHLRAQAFVLLQGIHENMHTANISDIKPLEAGHFVIVLAPTTVDKPPEVLLGEVTTMYTNSGARGARHEWISSARSVGIPSYINIRVYRHSHGNSYTSLACTSLGCATFLRIPRTHIIFSLATASHAFVRVDTRTDAGHPFGFVTLCAFSQGILKVLCDHRVAVSAAVRSLLELQKRKPGAKSVQAAAVGGLAPLEAVGISEGSAQPAEAESGSDSSDEEP
ncbi:hypothetical protein BV25DRAFT_1922630 [Artomyces pyxidatus]|uniref:Uncharacterized protein n=1 Tax=Artomyces pyxidatus TaxID=48021 RepID=A0ACB8SER9_9AGAM|nr:hypothetical protein BV25DRAFT_1922630 [Artomyces pyxidatus]